jgi:uncharacterized protein YndB with AHSA1/START domain
MTAEVQNLLVRRTIAVQAPPEHVFEVFVNRIDLWWPRSHHIGKDPRFTARLESKVGGRWYEVGSDGQECDWGRVLAYEPPGRLVLSWDITADWKHDPGLGTEVEVLFRREGEGTRVELEHRKIERYGSHAEAMLGVFSSERGWSGVLRALAELAAQ